MYERDRGKGEGTAGRKERYIGGQRSGWLGGRRVTGCGPEWADNDRGVWMCVLRLILTLPLLMSR